MIIDDSYPVFTIIRQPVNFPKKIQNQLIIPKGTEGVKYSWDQTLCCHIVWTFIFSESKQNKQVNKHEQYYKSGEALVLDLFL